MHANPRTTTEQSSEQAAASARSAESPGSSPPTERITWLVTGVPWVTSRTRWTALLRKTPRGPILQHVRTTVVSQRAPSETTLDAARELDELPAGLRARLPDDVIVTPDPIGDRNA